MENRLLNKKDVCEYLGISLGNLDGMIKKTPPLKLQVYYKFTATSNYTNFIDLRLDLCIWDPLRLLFDQLSEDSLQLFH